MLNSADIRRILDDCNHLPVPNPRQSWPQLIYHIILSFETYGVSFVWKIKNTFGEISSVEFLPAERLILNPANAYILQQPGGKTTVIQADQIIRLPQLRGRNDAGD